MSRMKLYHTGYQVIENPDIHHGRKNADFGQGFYVSDDREFCLRWARKNRDQSPIINEYELETAGLKIKSLERDETWTEYILANRRLQDDVFKEYDVICGPIANDTIYDTLGLISSGFLSLPQAVHMLKIGPQYRQIVLKSERAASQLHYITAETVSDETIESYRQAVSREEEEYQELFATALDALLNE